MRAHPVNQKENDPDESAQPHCCSRDRRYHRPGPAVPVTGNMKVRHVARSRRRRPPEMSSQMRKSDNAKRNIFRENVIHVGAGFVGKERPHVIQTLSTLEAHLGRWDPNDVDIDVSLQDRGGKEQRTTLRTTLPGHPPLVAVADNPDITRALGAAKRELIRQLEHQKSTHDPMNNRRLRRATIRHPVTSAPFEVARFALQDPRQTAARFSGQIGARP